MKSSVTYSKLSTLCKVQNGYAFDSKLFTSDSNDMPLVRIRDIKTGQTETFYKGNYSQEYVLHNGDYIIGMDGEFNITEWQGGDALLNQRVCRIIVSSNKLLPKYVLYFLPIPLRKIEDETPFVTVKHLSSKKLNDIIIPVPSIEEQQRIVDELDLLTGISDKKNAQLRDLDALAQSTFYEMFGDPNTNERGWKYKTLGNACALKAGKGIKASELSEEKAAGLYPCFGGNGIRGYIAKKSHKGTYPIIGRQGALCGNVQLATGEFYATEHAVVCTPGEGLHAVFVYYALLAMNLNQYATGVAQPGLAVKTLLPIPIVTPPMELQERFAEKICNIESQIDLLNVSLEQIDTLFHSRMDYYFND